MAKKVPLFLDDWIGREKERTGLTWEQVVLKGIEAALREQGKEIERPEPESSSGASTQ